jgi:hypothetical protein
MLYACVERFDVMGGRGNILGGEEKSKGQTSEKNGVRRNLSKKKIKTGNEPNAEATHPVPVSSTPPLT